MYPQIFQVKIVIIDSVTFHFRQDFEDLALRTRLLGGMALKLMNLAKTYNVAVSTSLFPSSSSSSKEKNLLYFCIRCNRLVNILPTYDAISSLLESEYSEIVILFKS